MTNLARQHSSRPIRVTAFLLAGSFLGVGACLAAMIAARGDGWDSSFLIPIAICLVGVTLALAAALRASLVLITCTLCYLGLHVFGDLIAVYMAIHLKWNIGQPRMVLIIAFELQFIAVYCYAVRVVFLEWRFRRSQGSKP